MTTLREALPDALVKPPIWAPIGRRFEGKECLASFLAFEAAEVLGGAKPGNLVNIVNRHMACGQYMYELWLRHGADLLAESPLLAFTLRDNGRNTLVYLYREDLLKRQLACPAVTGFLRERGFNPEGGTEQLLREMQLRFDEGGMPHEVGVILGYPLKDVLGFMGCGLEPLSCRGPWQIYGDPAPSLELVCSFRLCQLKMARSLAWAKNPRDCLGN
ncbi:MAG: DUF3793 domain-containing protein [Desulfuromonas sp.]|uniref:DUF3793 family protein n=1 Tax=Desulfuromonas sp. TaxID=892 RepID=UPI000CB4779C|nr:DUF3793 family protein [Desulfuromonas sp.]PLX83836.1 MAG: DUF3793 domain-containing protein [Desulfuromonas sp.]